MDEDEDPYAVVAKGKLKLKSDSGIKKNKKRKEKKFLEKVNKAIENEEQVVEKSDAKQQTKTKAELAFLQQQEKMVSTLKTILYFIVNCLL